MFLLIAFLGYLYKNTCGKCRYLNVNHKQRIKQFVLKKIKIFKQKSLPFLGEGL
ncbi:hypothetical protein SAMN05216464_10288 [Mucilaginibacter pineti]|uniref:Uncharacterized protein n=1 Tax=Mucilaginibacter pineti TaxID=1391627 RepID=A0A1G6W7U8_9SPHI|nr:hypothetical protein SAMN05216464_10288 [Mucilaginibacter pineti]